MAPTAQPVVGLLVVTSTNLAALILVIFRVFCASRSARVLVEEKKANDCCFLTLPKYSHLAACQPFQEKSMACAQTIIGGNGRRYSIPYPAMCLGPMWSFAQTNTSTNLC